MAPYRPTGNAVAFKKAILIRRRLLCGGGGGGPRTRSPLSSLSCLCRYLCKIFSAKENTSIDTYFGVATVYGGGRPRAARVREVFAAVMPTEPVVRHELAFIRISRKLRKAIVYISRPSAFRRRQHKSALSPGNDSRRNQSLLRASPWKIISCQLASQKFMYFWYILNILYFFFYMTRVTGLSL